MSQQAATIDKIRAAIRALRNSLEEKGDATHKYNVVMGVSFAPAKNLKSDDLVKSVEENKKVSSNLVYSMQAGLRTEPKLDISKETAIAELTAFEASLADLPQDIGGNMLLEFTVSNQHEKEIIESAQKAVNSIVSASENAQKLALVDAQGKPKRAKKA